MVNQPNDRSFDIGDRDSDDCAGCYLLYLISTLCGQNGVGQQKKLRRIEVLFPEIEPSGATAGSTPSEAYPRIDSSALCSASFNQAPDVVSHQTPHGCKPDKHRPAPCCPGMNSNTMPFNATSSIREDLQERSKEAYVCLPRQRPASGR